jgi:hypothetical protein
VIASPNRKYPPEPDALALAALVVESLDELTPRTRSSPRRSEHASSAPRGDGPKIHIADAAMTVLDAADGLSTSRGRQRSYDRFWHKADIQLAPGNVRFRG